MLLLITFYDGRLKTIRLITTINRTFKSTYYDEKTKLKSSNPLSLKIPEHILMFQIFSPWVQEEWLWKRQLHQFSHIFHLNDFILSFH